MSNQQTQSVTVRDLMRIFTHRRWRFLFMFFGITLVVLGGSLFLPRTYQASAIFERRNDLVMSEIVGRGAPHSFDMLKRSLTEELRGRPAITRAIDDLGLAPLPDEQTPQSEHALMLSRRQKLLEHIPNHLRVYFDISTNEVDRVRVVFNDNDPRRAAAVANQLVANYIRSTREQIDRMLSEAADFFAQQADETREKIAKLEEKRLRFEIENAELLPSDGSGGVQETLAALDERLALLKRRHRAAEARVKRLENERDRMADDQPQSVVRGMNPQYQHIEKRLVEYKDRLERALVIDKMTERHPTVTVLRDKIAQISAELKETPKQIVTQRVYASSDALRSELELKLAEATAEHDAVAEELSAVSRQAARLQAQSSQYFPVRSAYRQLARAIEKTQEQASFWEDNQRRVVMALDAELGRRGIALNFIQPSGRIQRPISPDPIQVLFAAVGLGLLAGVAWIVLADRADQSLHTLEQANRSLGIPVLGSVAEIISGSQQRWRRLWQRVGQPAVLAGLIVLLGAAFYLSHQWLTQPQAHAHSDPAPDAPSASVDSTTQAPAEASFVIVKPS